MWKIIRIHNTRTKQISINIQEKSNNFKTFESSQTYARDFWSPTTWKQRPSTQSSTIPRSQCTVQQVSHCWDLASYFVKRASTTSTLWDLAASTLVSSAWYHTHQSVISGSWKLVLKVHVLRFNKDRYLYDESSIKSKIFYKEFPPNLKS